MKKIIAKIIGEKEKDIQWRGLRTDKNKTKEEFHTFECYRKMRLAMEENGLPPIEELSKDTLDKIGEILTLNTERDAIEERLRADELNLNLSEKMIQFLVGFRKENADLFTKWHSFSLKLMNELIPEMYEQPKEQMTLLTEHNLLKVKQQDFKGKNYIPADMVSDKIFNPVVAKSVRISFRIFNELLKKYKHFDQIVLELPRDKNSDEEKKRIISSQDKNEKEWKEIEKILEERKILIPHRIYTNSKNLKLKLRLWKEQEGKCLYSGKMIDLEELIYEGHLFEIDHIIPFSVLPDDSRTNKVLVYATENQKKKNRTPYDYLMHTNEHQSFEEYKANVLYLYKNNKISKKKMENLLFMENLNKAEVMKEFINRNINDTGYAARVVLNTIQGFMKAREEDTKVKVIRGSFTHQMRVNLGLPKDRDESNAHHAVDAMLMGYAQMGYAEYNRKQSAMIDLETGEILDPTMEISEKEYEKLLYLAEKYQEILREIKCAEQKIRYWHEIDRKCNRGLCNQTIRGTRKLNDDPEDQTVVKINKLDIRTDDWKTFKKFAGSEKDREKLLVYRHDEKTYEELVRIMHDYADGNNNPFVKFEEEHGPIRKYAKNHNGPKIGKLKYIAGKVSSCIDISHKYGHPKGSKKVILESLEPYRMDVYYNKEKGQYYLVGIKQSDIKCESGKYVIDEEAYAARLRKDKMITGTESRADLESKGYEFMYSFYRNEIIEYEKNGIIKKERFWSKIDYFKNKIEVKPLEKNSYYEEDGKGDIIRDKNGKPKTKQQFVTLTKATCIRKYNKDILGKEYVCSKEKFSSECW